MEANVYRLLATATLVTAALAIGGSSHAQEEEFFSSLDGSWSGSGSVRLRADSGPVNVSCRFNSDTTPTSMALDGSCTGLVVVSRDIGATIKAAGNRYTGVYRGSRSGPAALSGRQSGNSLNLAIRWAKNVNGDRSAELKLEKVGDDGMRLTTVDEHPTTGETVIISQIDLKRR
jgi:hypothetical protein